MQYAVEFRGCCTGCDSVHAHSANRKRLLLYVLFTEIKCQEQGPTVSLVQPPAPREGSVGVVTGGGGVERELWGCNAYSSSGSGIG